MKNKLLQIKENMEKEGLVDFNVAPAEYSISTHIKSQIIIENILLKDISALKRNLELFGDTVDLFEVIASYDLSDENGDYNGLSDGRDCEWKTNIFLTSLDSNQEIKREIISRINKNEIDMLVHDISYNCLLKEDVGLFFEIIEYMNEELVGNLAEKMVDRWTKFKWDGGVEFKRVIESSEKLKEQVYNCIIENKINLITLPINIVKNRISLLTDNQLIDVFNKSVDLSKNINLRFIQNSFVEFFHIVKEKGLIKDQIISQNNDSNALFNLCKQVMYDKGSPALSEKEKFKRFLDDINNTNNENKKRLKI